MHCISYGACEKETHSDLGNASKFRNRVTPIPINRVPIFSDRLNIGTDFIGAEWNGIGNGSHIFIGLW